MGGTEVEIDAQDRLWRFGDIRYGYTPDGRTTWRRERFANGTERLLCLDYDVFSGLHGASWVTEGSGEELGCDEVAEFDGTVDYRLDATGRRIVTDRTEGGVTTREYFVYGDALHPIARLDDQRRLAQLYLYADGAHTPTAMIAYSYSGESVTRTPFGFVTDPRGSVRLVVRLDDGAVVQRLDYGPFGEIILDNNSGFQPFGYAGGIYDADTGFVRFGARDYDAETGRWLSLDPIGFAGGDANLFAYVGGDPVNAVDPTGLIPLWVRVGYVGICGVWALVDDTGGLDGVLEFANEVRTLQRHLEQMRMRQIELARTSHDLHRVWRPRSHFCGL